MKRTITKSALLIMTLAILSFGACKKSTTEDTPQPANPSGFALLKEGNEQKFSLRTIDTQNGIDTTLANAQIIKVNKDLGNGKFRVITSTDMMGQTSIDTAIYKKDASGLWYGTHIDTMFLFINSSPSVGEVLKYKKVNAKDTTIYKVMSINENIIIKDTTYSCVKVKEFDGSQNENKDFTLLWIDLKTCMVKTESFENNSLSGSTIMTSKNF